MLLLPLLSQEFTYRSRTKHNLLDISSHLNLSFSLSPSTWSIISPSTFLPVDLQIHGATDRPVTLIQLADVGAVNEPTARWQTDRWFFVWFFRFWRGNNFKVFFFSHLTFRKVRNTARTLRTSKSTTSPCVIYISPLRLSEIIWLGHEGQLRMATWSWLVEF